MNLSAHTALHTHPRKRHFSRIGYATESSNRLMEVVQMKISRACQSLRSTSITKASTLLRVDLPLIDYWSHHFTGEGFFSLNFMAYGFLLFSSKSFPCSVLEPNLDSCHGLPTCSRFTPLNVLHTFTLRVRSIIPVVRLPLAMSGLLV